MLRITLAQINPTIGDIDGNAALMQKAAGQALADRADLIVFPELSLTGYYPGDLLDEPGFLARLQQGFSSFLDATRQWPELHWVVGVPLFAEDAGKDLQNTLLVLKNGEILLRYAKQLLPTYNVFNERRHFTPGPDVARVLRIGGGGMHVGFMICEDGWNDDGSAYEVNPFQRLADAAPDLVVSINASPSNIGKREQRQALFAAASRRHGWPIVYVNQVGGHDSLVFDGGSFVVTPEQVTVFEAESFVEEIVTLEFDGSRFYGADDKLPGTAVELPKSRRGRGNMPPMEFYRRQIILGLRDYVRRCGFRAVLAGSSGGIDSALVLALAAEAVGAENVVAVTMPSQHSSVGSVDDSVTLCRNLGIRLFEHPIRALVEQYSAGFAGAFASPLQGLALENLQARIRGVILMEYSNSFGHLLLTTGNKSEISVGYCTLYGDTNGGLGPIGDLYKTEVFELSRHINESAGRELIPQAIIDKEPSAELAPGQRDVDSLPPYPVLDDILKYVIEGQRLEGAEKAAVEAHIGQLEKTEAGAALIARVKRMVITSEYKRRQLPPVLRVRSRAFGSGRQMPVAARLDF